MLQQVGQPFKNNLGEGSVVTPMQGGNDVVGIVAFDPAIAANFFLYLANSWTCIKVSHLHRIGHVMVEFSIVKSWMGVCWGIISTLWIVARVKSLIALAKAQRTISLKFASL